MADSEIPITQINLHHSKGASAILARSMAAMQTGISLIQEPWLLKNAVMGLRGCGNLYYTRSESKSRTCVITKGLNATFLPQLSGEDLTAIQLRINLENGRFLDVLVGSAYMAYDSKEHPPLLVKKLVAYAEERGLELLLGCDANSHHVAWGSTGINPRGEDLHDFVMGSRLVILNRGTEPTFLDCRRQEVIDITICTEGVSELVGDWRVSNEPSGSDHRLIGYTIRHSREIIWARNPRNTNWEGYRQELSDRLSKAPTRFHDKDDLDRAAQCLTEAISDAYEANSPLRLKNNSTRLPWWNKGLSKLKAEVRKLFNKAKSSRVPAHWEAFRRSQRRYSKEIVKAKRKSWWEFCEAIESAPEASRLCRILSSSQSPHLGCLKLPDGDYTNNTTETLKHLMEVHFPEFQSNQDLQAEEVVPFPREVYRPREWSLAAKVVHPEGVEWAVKTFNSFKSPGPDGIYPAFL